MVKLVYAIEMSDKKVKIDMLYVAAVIPALVCLFIVYLADRHKERLSFVARLYVLGALIVLPAGLMEKMLLDLYSATPDPQTGFMATLMTAFFIAGVTEETAKGLVFQRFVLPKPFYDEPYDGVVYAVAIGLGFATVENVLYVTSDGLSTAFVRAFTAVPAHTLFGVVMGTYFSQSKFAQKPVFKAYAIPAFLHGLYDMFALAQSFAANIALIIYLMWLVRFACTKSAPLRRLTRKTYRVS